MVVVIGRVRVAEDELDSWSDLIVSLVEHSRAEPGCVSYSFSRDLDDPSTFRISEEWLDRDSLVAHMDSEHFRRWSRALRERTVREREATVYEATEISLS